MSVKFHKPSKSKAILQGGIVGLFASIFVSIFGLTIYTLYEFGELDLYFFVGMSVITLIYIIPLGTLGGVVFGMIGWVSDRSSILYGAIIGAIIGAAWIVFLLLY